MNYPRISTTISKLGVAIPTVNLPAGITCRDDAPCKDGCYACKGNFAFKSAKTGLARNLEAFERDSEFFFRKIILTLMMVPYQFFRWHSSGDIVNEDYFAGMIRVAKAVPTTRFLCFTKKYEIVNAYLENNELPDNLVVVFSHWRGIDVPNPHNLPTAHVRFKKGENNIPEEAIECSGFCGNCVGGEQNCWKLKKGEAVVFNQH